VLSIKRHRSSRLSPGASALLGHWAPPKHGWPEQVRPAQAAITSELIRDLLDLGFAKFDVLLGDRIVFLLDQFIGHGARILSRHVIEAGVRAGHELDFDRRILGHEILRVAVFRET
jgi:hypothetical protein